MLSCQIKTYGVPQHLLLLVIAPSPTPSPYKKKQKNNVNSSDQSDMHTLLFMYEIMRWKPPRPKYTYTSENNKLCVGAGSAPVKPLCPKSCDFFSKRGQTEFSLHARFYLWFCETRTTTANKIRLVPHNWKCLGVFGNSLHPPPPSPILLRGRVSVRQLVPCYCSEDYVSLQSLSVYGPSSPFVSLYVRIYVT